jgi:DNA-binding NtrC family response regulator
MHHHANAGPAFDLQLPVEMIGAGPSIRRAADAVRRAAGCDDTVLIVAEPGFSPERIARAIHDAGARAAKPFISIDCGDTPTAVVQRLFGAERKSRSQYETVTADSALAEAGEGTVFLADVSEMPAAAQLRLSRLMRDGEMRVRRSTAQVRFRLMASAAPGLGADVHQNRFRPELYRRLQRLRVDVPPLRDRSGDLPALIDVVLADIRTTRGVGCTLTPAARTALAALRWAGNIEELHDALVRLADRCDGNMIRQEDVLADLQHAQARPRRVHAPLASLREARQTFEREYISTVLEEYGWRMTEAARVLGIERANLYRKTRQLGITRLKPSRTS